MLRRILSFLIVPLILFAPQLSCCCLSEYIASKSAKTTVAEVKSCCETKAEPSKHKGHQCACDKVSKSNVVEQSKANNFASKIIFDEAYIVKKENSFFVGLFPVKFSNDDNNFYITIRKDPPRSYYLYYCAYLI